MNSLPPDPYLALGVPKTAQIAEIRSAHRKRVLKCHPDKVQDEALKAIKQDEFQKVQQAYELLSDETKRTQYDQQVKLFELRKEMGRVPVGAGANVYYAEPRSASAAYRTKPPPQAYASRYDSDESKYTTPRRSSGYETKPKSSSREEERRSRRKEEERLREADLRERESKREKEAHAERKKNREKDRRKEDKSTSRYIEDESDSEELRRPSRPPTKIRLADVVDMATKAARGESRRGGEIVDAAELRREKTKVHLGNAYQYIKAANKQRTPSARTVKIPTVPEPPAISTIEEEDEVPRSSRRTTRRTSADTPSSSRRTQNSSRSRESPPRLSSKDKKRSDPRLDNIDIPFRAKPTFVSQKSAPPEVTTSREKPLRSNTMDDKHSSKGYSIPPQFARASTFHGSEKTQPRSGGHKYSGVYDTVSETDSELDSPTHIKQPSPSRERPTVQKTSSYRIVKDINGQRAAAQIHELGDLYEEPPPRERSPSRTTSAYPRTSSSRPSNHRAQTQPLYAQPVPAVERESPRVREAQPQWSSSRQVPSPYDKVKVNYSAPITQDNVLYSEDFMRRGSDAERFANYPAPNQNHRREEFPPRKMAYVG